MCLYITSLNSGSNGNCYYIGNETEAVLIDAGLSCRETENRMRLNGLSMKIVKAIFISHEHTDHIKGLSLLAEKYNLPVYITSVTLRNSCLSFSSHLPKTFKAYEPVHVDGLTITAFPKYHDAEDPHSFIISYNNVSVGVFTDIGRSCTHVTNHFSKCDAAFLEANYDEDLLRNGRYPVYLKRRISSGQGHLSNKQALEVFIKYRPPFMSHLFLSHLSKENNCPLLAKQLFEKHSVNTKIIVASRYEQTAVYAIEKRPYHLPVRVMNKTSLKSMQLELFA